MSRGRSLLLAAASGCAIALTATIPDPVLAAEPAARDVWPVTCTGTAPIVCNAAVAPGNYDVSVTLGDREVAASTAVEAETRRLMVAETATRAGELVRHNFTVNVREPESQPTSTSIGTPGLTLTFTGSAPRARHITVRPVRDDWARADHVRKARGDRTTVMYVVGDSTVCDQYLEPWTGWGQMITQYFGPGLSVANYADSGESTVSFLANSLLWATMIPLVQRDDLVLIQFGHNDKTTTADEYLANLTRMVTEVLARDARPVLISPPVRRRFDSSGKLDSVALHLAGFDRPAAVRQVASAQGVPFINLTADSTALVEGLGVAASKAIFLTVEKGDNTHFSEYGADQMAQLVLTRLKELNLLPPYGPRVEHPNPRS